MTLSTTSTVHVISTDPRPLQPQAPQAPAASPAASGPLAAAPPASRVQRVRHELKRRLLTVTQVQRLSPHVVSVTLAGDDLADFVSLGFDDHVKLLFDAADGPAAGAGGAGIAEPARRDYTPRHFDRAARRLTIEFALHGPGVASDWARQAQPGQQLWVGGPRGSMVVPLDHDWHLLAGDDSALPAIHRRLEELPAGTRALVLVHLADSADQRAFSSAAALQVQWCSSPAQWLDALRDLVLPPGDGFAWCAGESRLMAQARDLLLHHHHHPRHAMKVAAYWKPGVRDFHETLDG